MIDTDPDHTERMREVAAQLGAAAQAKKCWSCGCLHHSLNAIEQGLPTTERPAQLAAAIDSARSRLAEVRYDCLGCDVCYPALALNALGQAGAGRLPGVVACPTDTVEARKGWPPLPGAYTVVRYQAPIAICTLTDGALAEAIVGAGNQHLAMVGTLQTENLGVERVIQNLLANPNVRFLIVCGADSRQAIGHLPGQSLVALADAGLDERGRIIGARGKRPVIRNLSREAVEHFRHTVEVIDRAGRQQVTDILETVSRCAERNPDPAQPYQAETVVTPVAGYAPTRMVPDPAGYVVVYADRARQRLSLEHYRTDGVLDAVVEGRTAVEVYTPAIEGGLLSRLDHAAYLGRELTRAEQALTSGQPYVQDAAPERPRPEDPPACRSSCSPPCGQPVTHPERDSVR